jgi:hypothetical protein
MANRMSDKYHAVRLRTVRQLHAARETVNVEREAGRQALVAEKKLLAFHFLTSRNSPGVMP